MTEIKASPPAALPIRRRSSSVSVSLINLGFGLGRRLTHLKFIARNPRCISGLFQGRDFPLNWCEQETDVFYFTKGFSVLNILEKFYSCMWRLRPPSMKPLGSCADGPPLIISVASIEERLEMAYITLCSLMSQTRPADRVLLWLPDGIAELPRRFKILQNRGLEIKFTPEIGPYKKLLPTLKANPEAIIVTADDDMIYPSRWLENLERSYVSAPKNVHCYISRCMSVDSNDEFTPYLQWETLGERAQCADADRSSRYLLPVGAGGVLYPPGALHEDVARKDIFSRLCPYADDLWYKAMTLRNGVTVTQVHTSRPWFVEAHWSHNGGGTLMHYNWLHNGNSIQWRRLLKQYDLAKFLRQNSKSASGQDAQLV